MKQPSKRTEWNLQKCFVLLLGCHVLIWFCMPYNRAHILQFTLTATCLLLHHFTGTFFGWSLESFELAILPCTCPLNTAKFWVHMHNDSQFQLLSGKYFVYSTTYLVSYGDLKIKSKYAQNWVHLPSSPHCPTLSSTWSMTLSISLLICIRNHGLILLVVLLKHLLSTLCVPGSMPENSVVIIKRPGPCMAFTI